MSRCLHCNTEIPAHARFCPVCGKPQDPPASTKAAPPDGSISTNTNIELASSGQARGEEPTQPLFSEKILFESKKRELADTRGTVAKNLLSVVQFVEGSRQEENKRWFERAALQSPPLEDKLWSDIAFVAAGVYGNFMWKRPLSTKQRCAMWQAIVWGVWYEWCYRAGAVDKRLQQGVAHFLRGGMEDSEFLTSTFSDLETLIRILNQTHLKKVQEVLQSVTPSSQAARLVRKIEALLASEPSQHGQGLASAEISFEQVAPAIEQLWEFLDKRKDTQNRAILNEVRQEPQKPEVLHRLSALTGVICRNIVYRYTHGSSVSSKQLNLALLLAAFSIQHSTGEFVALAQQQHFLLQGLEQLRSRSLEPNSFITELQTRFGSNEQGGASGILSQWMAMVTHYLTERRQEGIADFGEAEAWIRVFANLSDIGQGERRQFVTEVRAYGVPNSIALQRLEIGLQTEQNRKQERGPLAFLHEERRKEFLESIRSSQGNSFSRIQEILREARQPLLSALSRALADQSFREILPPQRPIQIGGRNTLDRFPEAKRLIMSQDIDERRKALPLFEQAMREARKDYIPLTREWRLFALARVHGNHRVASDWEEDRKRGASWEEIWNLAVFYMQFGNNPAKALDVLASGIEQMKAPLSHLHFALYCSVQIVEQPVHDKETTAVAIRYLTKYLTKLPLPECYLAWLLFIDEGQHQVDLIEQSRVLSHFQELLDQPIVLLRPEDRLDDATIEAFQKVLQGLRLEDTWRLWLNEYTRRNPYYYKGWQWLSEASERAGDLDQAEWALQQIIDVQMKSYEQQLKRNPAQANPRFVRISLSKLFEFYRRSALPTNSKTAFDRYYKRVPQLWDGKDISNNHLINLTRPYLDEVLKEKSTPPISPPDSSNTWLILQSELAAAKTVADLQQLQARLNAAIDLLPITQKIARDRMLHIKGLLAEICTLDTTDWHQEQLLREVDRLNRSIQDARNFVEQEAVLRQLKALVAALSRTFKAFSDAQRLQPKLQVDETPLGGGLACDISETALVVRVSNPGPGEVTNIHVSCSDKGAVLTRKEGVLARLAEHGEDIVAIPVTTRCQPGDTQVECQINFAYQWGVINDLTVSHDVRVNWFNYHDVLQRHGVNAYEIPNPYVFDTPIDFTKHDPRLFQGRESEIALIQTVFLKGQLLGIPLYFHGIRKVGKTSLLHRLTLELKKSAILPVVIDLHGIYGSQQTLPLIINSFTDRILRNAPSQGLDVRDMRPVQVDEPNPIVAVETFFEALRERAGSQHLVLLLDEFQVIVAQAATPLLDLLRRIHQRDLIWFVMSGWMRPETMRRLCPETQLFPLNSRSVDFLPKEVVKQVLHAPIANFGIEIPSTTIDHLYMQTAGNPYHVAKLAWYGITRLNAEHRTVLAPQDVDEIAAILASDPANFTSSSLSPLILTETEQNTATAFAKALPNGQELLSIKETLERFDVNIIQQLEEKYILELQGEYIKVKSNMLATYLRSRLSEPLEVKRLTQSALAGRVGLFVDFENIWPLVPPDVNPKALGDLLTTYAARFGDVVCRWACADPRNLSDPTGIRLGLEKAGFSVRYPRSELQKGLPIKNETDFVLLETITDESEHSQPDVYILASGDRDYYEKVRTLLNKGYTVRILASKSNTHLSKKYRDLEKQREQTRFAEGYTSSDFFIDDLDEVLYSR